MLQVRQKVKLRDGKVIVRGQMGFRKTVKSADVVLYHTSNRALEYATSIATGIAQKTVPLTGLRKMRIPIPPESEQYKIVAKVDELIAHCDTLKTRINTAQVTRFHLADTMAEQALN